mmetsp:Transcript_78712/g.109357  ORF Transcript_78712/g.109357 Transcript_78712/m.109357 type:complete len:256 (-) Transcript_78712:250-1017(-)
MLLLAPCHSFPANDLDGLVYGLQLLRSELLSSSIVRSLLAASACDILEISLICCLGGLAGVQVVAQLGLLLQLLALEGTLLANVLLLSCLLVFETGQGGLVGGFLFKLGLLQICLLLDKLVLQLFQQLHDTFGLEFVAIYLRLLGRFDQGRDGCRHLSAGSFCAQVLDGELVKQCACLRLLRLDLLSVVGLLLHHTDGIAKGRNRLSVVLQDGLEVLILFLANLRYVLLLRYQGCNVALVPFILRSQPVDGSRCL